MFLGDCFSGGDVDDDEAQVHADFGRDARSRRFVQRLLVPRRGRHASRGPRAASPPAPPPPPAPVATTPAPVATAIPVPVKITATTVGNRVHIPGEAEFDVDKATLKLDSPDTMNILNALHDFMAQNAQVTLLRVEGHTDNTGAADHNLKLSQERADAVVAWEVQAGIDKSRLVGKGHGATKPAFPNDTDENRHKPPHGVPHRVDQRQARCARAGGCRRADEVTFSANPK